VILEVFEDVIPAPVPESPFPLLDEKTDDEFDCKTDEDRSESDELNSSTALLSPPSGPELLPSSPQAIRKKSTVA
jgi:hypothetical protein